MRHGFLVDTNVISETRKAHPNAGVTAFFKAGPEHLFFLSVLTLGELRKGAAMCRKSNISYAGKLSDWIDGIENKFGDRIVPVDLRIAQTWGELASDRTRPVIDTLLLATAVSRDMTLVTRNTIDVRGTAAQILNPFV